MSRNEPRIVVFACNWDGLSSVEAATREGHSYPSCVRLVRVACLARLNQGLILKAFELGADAVMLVGCEPGNCQFENGPQIIEHEYEKARTILQLLGIGEERLLLVRLPRADGEGFAAKLTGFVEQVERARPALPARPL